MSGPTREELGKLAVAADRAFGKQSRIGELLRSYPLPAGEGERADPLTTTARGLAAHELVCVQVHNAAIEAAALIVCPEPHVEEEVECSEVARRIRGLKRLYRSAEIAAMFARRETLADMRLRSAAEDRELEALRARIGKLPTARSPADQEAADEIRRAAGLLRAPAAGPAPEGERTELAGDIERSYLIFAENEEQWPEVKWKRLIALLLRPEIPDGWCECGHRISAHDMRAGGGGRCHGGADDGGCLCCRERPQEPAPGVSVESVKRLALALIANVNSALPEAARTNALLPVPDDRPTTLRHGAIQGWETALRALIRALPEAQPLQPWGYGIVEEDGSAFWGERCVSDDPQVLWDETDEGCEAHGLRVVRLFWAEIPPQEPGS